MKPWNIEEQTGYKPLTTCYEDLSIAEFFGLEAILDTLKNLKEEFKNNYKYETELVMALNWKIWQWYKTNEPLAKLYNKLWQEYDSFVIKKYEDNKEAISYYYRTTD